MFFTALLSAHAIVCPKPVAQAELLPVFEDHGFIKAEAAAHPAIIPHMKCRRVTRVHGVIHECDAGKAILITSQSAAVITPARG